MAIQTREPRRSVASHFVASFQRYATGESEVTRCLADGPDGNLNPVILFERDLKLDQTLRLLQSRAIRAPASRTNDGTGLEGASAGEFFFGEGPVLGLPLVE